MLLKVKDLMTMRMQMLMMEAKIHLLLTSTQKSDPKEARDGEEFDFLCLLQQLLVQMEVGMKMILK